MNICNKYFLKKNGKINYYRNNINHFDNIDCIINDKINYNNFDLSNLKSKNEDIFINKLLLLYKCVINKLNYIELHNNIYIFKNTNVKYILYTYFLQYINNKKYKNTYNFFINNDYNLYTTYFFIHYLFFNKKKNKNESLIYVFYELYIFIQKKNIYLKYKKKLNDFENFNKLYIFLKKNNYVNEYYNKYVPYILKNYKKIYDKFINNSLLPKFIKRKMKYIKNFNEIDFNELIHKYANKNFDKIYIKNKFNEIIKKYI